MKKIWLAVLTLTVFAVSGVLAEPDYEKAAQEADRNRELLEIWKEHVKTLTRERDDAYSQMERMKAASPAGMAQFGAVESMPLPSQEAVQQIEGLQSEVSRLQMELQRKASTDPNRELQMQFSAMQNQLQQMKKELNEARTEKDRLIREKERALSQVERLSAGSGSEEIRDSRLQELEQRYIALEQENESLRQRLSQPQETPAAQGGGVRERQLEEETQSLRGENAGLLSEIERLKMQASRIPVVSGTDSEGAFARRSRELQYENETLRAQIEKLQVVEKELANTRSYFTPIVKELQQKHDRLAEENRSLSGTNAGLKEESSRIAGEIQSLRSQSQQVQRDSEKASSEIDTLKTESQRLQADLSALRTERDQMGSQVENYKSQLQMAAADKERIQAAEGEIAQLRSQNESVGSENARLSQEAEGLRTQVQQLSAQAATLESANREYATRESTHERAAEKYKTALTANLTDMKNLKANFEAYLDSLVASFEERQK